MAGGGGFDIRPGEEKLLAAQTGAGHACDAPGDRGRSQGRLARTGVLATSAIRSKKRPLKSVGVVVKPALSKRMSHVASTAVQQPIQQRRRTSAIKHNTQRTEKSRFKHKKDTGEHQRTTQVESPLRHSSFFYVHQRPFQAQNVAPMSTEIHQNPLLSIGFAVKGD